MTNNQPDPTEQGSSPKDSPEATGVGEQNSAPQASADEPNPLAQKSTPFQQQPAPQYAPPQYSAPQYNAPEYSAPQQAQPQYAAPQQHFPPQPQAQPQAQPNPYGYAQPAPQYATAPVEPKGKSITSFVLGLVSLVFGLTVVVPVAGLILGIIGYKQEPSAKGFSITGIVLSGLVLLGVLFFFFIFFIAIVLDS